MLTFGDVLLSFLTSQAVALLQLLHVAAEAASSEGRQQCGFVDKSVSLGIELAWVQIPAELLAR